MHITPEVSQVRFRRISIVDTTTFAAPESQYYRKEYPKRTIVLHFTVSSSAASVANWWRKTHTLEGVAFLVDRDGRIYQYFDPHCWANHLFRHKRGERPEKYKMEHESIGIEIVNMGPLTLGRSAKDKDVLYDAYKQPHCTLDETAKYVQKTHRSRHYWAYFTAEQYDRLRFLLKLLADEFQIPLRNRPLGPRSEVWMQKRLAVWEGVCAHENYRSDKFDIGPAFDYDMLNIPVD